MARARGFKRWFLGGVLLLVGLGTIGLYIGSQQGLHVDRLTTARADILVLKTQLIIYQAMTGSYPTIEQGLEALVNRPEAVPNSWKQLLSEIPKDPWRRVYVYRRSSGAKYSDIDVFSLGPDGVESADDIRAER